MKLTIISGSLLWTQLCYAYVAQPALGAAKSVQHDKRQFLATLTELLGKGGKVPDPPGAAPRRQVASSPTNVNGAKRVKLRYGPYSVAGMNKTSVNGEEGMLWNYPDLAIEKPCARECTIIGQQAGLEYPDGKNANIDTGLWLHHMVHFTVGPDRWDPTCYGKRSLPHFAVNSSPLRSERYFSSGNERTRIPFDFLGDKTATGYHISQADKFAFIIDLMNMNMEDKVVYMTMTYDYVDGPLPSGWKNVKAIWLDARQCGTSEIIAPQQTGTFAIESKPWVPNFDGEMQGMIGHCHDGGVKVTTKSSPDQVACVSKAGYSEKPEFGNSHAILSGSGGHGHGIAPGHISSMTTCLNQPGATAQFGKLSKDQSWTVAALYDYDKFPGNKNGKGTQDEIMAISLMYASVEPNLPRPR